MTPKEAISQARNIVAVMKQGGLTYEAAKRQCQPLFDIANAKGKEIAKKYNKRYIPISFASFAR